jgi:hypothetical protein
MSSTTSLENNSISRCLGLTKKGIPCKNKCSGSYCHKHRGQGASLQSASLPSASLPSVSSGSRRPQVQPQDCCVCYDETKDILSCKHYLCKGCVKHLCTDTCPMCRAPLKGRHVTTRLLMEIRGRQRRTNEQLNYELATRIASSEVPRPRRRRLSRRNTNRTIEPVYLEEDLLSFLYSSELDFDIALYINFFYT